MLPVMEDEVCLRFFRLFLMIDHIAPSVLERRIDEKEKEISKTKSEDKIKQLNLQLGNLKKSREKIHEQRWIANMPPIQWLVKNGLLIEISHGKDEEPGSEKEVLSAKYILSDYAQANKNMLLEEIQTTLKSRNSVLCFGVAKSHKEIAEIMHNVSHRRITQKGEESMSFNKSHILFRPFDAIDTPDWFMSVPACFNGALGITIEEGRTNFVPHLTYRQSSFFSFSEGDALYKDPASRKKGEDLIQITSAEPVRIGNSGDRFPGRVTFATHGSLREIGHGFSISQDDFVKFLIQGPSVLERGKC